MSMHLVLSSNFNIYYILFNIFFCFFSLSATLERNQHITIAHVNPECYNSVPLSTNNGQPLALPPGMIKFPHYLDRISMII